MASSSYGTGPFDNIVLLTDSYKTSHFKQYPPDSEFVYSYFESRGGLFKEICFFGLQYFIKRYLCGPVVTQEKIDEAEELVAAHMGSKEAFNRAGWEHILKAHGGHLPISIKSVPEGTMVPVKNVLFTMVNTDPKCYWLTNYLETLLVEVWYPMTVCTNSREQKKILDHYFTVTASPRVAFGFKLHDFGFRGVSSVESAAIGGAGHLVNFLGTDTMAALQCARKFYGEAMAGFSVAAAEHSTITSWGRDRELAAYQNMLTQYPTGICSVVSDSYNVFEACEKMWGGALKEQIMARKPDSPLVVRPDSGDPVEMVPKLLDILGKQFDEHVTKTETGYKLLPPQIRLIQGDGISYDSIGKILEATMKAGWAADNVVFGSGGALLQKMNRDTQKCAFKCSELTHAGGKTTQVFKEPITDKGKVSKKGRLTLERGADGVLTTITENRGDPAKDILVEVFRDGKLLVDQTFADIRARANEGFAK